MAAAALGPKTCTLNIHLFSGGVPVAATLWVALLATQGSRLLNDRLTDDND
jgi:hypothetical protein